MLISCGAAGDTGILKKPEAFMDGPLPRIGYHGNDDSLSRGMEGQNPARTGFLCTALARAPSWAKLEEVEKTLTEK
jgi:hypothetical protein